MKMRHWKSYFPILQWGGNYKSSDLSGDISAGLTVGVMLIPQGMAYAMLAGLPPIYGLYASTIPLIIYALFGTSRQLAVGPAAMIALLVASGIGTLATAGSPEYIQLSIALSLMVGVLLLLLGVFRLGFVVNFLSHPVISGFTTAAAIIIAFSQMKHILGISIPRGNIFNTIQSIFKQLGDIHLTTFLIGGCAIGILLFLKKLNRRIPGPLIIVLFGMLVVGLADLHLKGVSIVGTIPDGLPDISIPTIDPDMIKRLFPFALTIAFIGFMESIAVAKAIQSKHKDYEVVPNQELIALGLANIAGALFKAFPVAGGFGRSAVNDQSGARTGLASIISSLLVIFTLLFLTGYFYYLPTAVLAAIIMVAVIGLIDVKEVKHLWKTDFRDFILFTVTALGTLILGVEEGILIGVVLSLVGVVYHASYPHIAKLGRIPGTGQFRNVNRFVDLEQPDDLLIFRFDAQLYFANANVFKDYIHQNLSENPDIRFIVIHGGSITRMDSSAVHMMNDLIDELNARAVTIYFAAMTGPVRDIMAKNRLVRKLGTNRFFLNVHDAVEFIRTGSTSAIHHHSLQTNVKTIG